MGKSWGHARRQNSFSIIVMKDAFKHVKGQHERCFAGERLWKLDLDIMIPRYSMKIRSPSQDLSEGPAITNKEVP